MDIKNNKGVTLPIVLLTLMILIFFGTTILFITSSQAKFNYADDRSKTALGYAEAGYNEYLWHLNDDVNFYSTEKHKKMMNTPIAFQDGYYMLEVIKPSDTDRFITIKSTGWTKDSPERKRTIVAKIRKKQFVHYVYVTNGSGNTWWTSGDEVHGPYHTNGFLQIEKRPKFYDIVSYKIGIKKGNGYDPDFKVKEPKQPELLKDGLEFPESNSKLEKWAEKDGMVFSGRTCIYLNGDEVKLRNGNAKREEIQTIPISDITNKVIYVDNSTSWKNSKFNLEAGNIFISGKLKGQLTIAAANNIYITATDPTNWYEEYDESRKGEDLPITDLKGENELYGVMYANTKFNENKPKGTISYRDEEKGIWTRNANGKDMLGLVAQNDIMILHYGWPRYMEGGESTYNKPYWNYRWVLKRDYPWSNYYWDKQYVSDKYYDVAPQNINIHAALFAVKGGFGYENCTNGKRKGDIIVWGSATQNQMMATEDPYGRTGYSLICAHDPRMFYDYPPHILEPTNVGWEVHDWREITDYVKQ